MSIGTLLEEIIVPGLLSTGALERAPRRVELPPSSPLHLDLLVLVPLPDGIDEKTRQLMLSGRLLPAGATLLLKAERAVVDVLKLRVSSSYKRALYSMDPRTEIRVNELVS